MKKVILPAMVCALQLVSADPLRADPCPDFSDYGPITVHQDVYLNSYAGGAAWAWTPTGAMHYAQTRGTATRLLDGRVLAAGTAAEVFNPADGSWMLTVGGPNILNKGHMDCAAVLLPDGKVLLAGGWNGNGLTKTAQIYDPASNSWTDAADMHNGHGGLTLTVLPNGKVLACGIDFIGVTPPPTSPSAELFDPATGTWTPTGEMVIPRHSHTATLLPNGKVLIAGGRYGEGNGGIAGNYPLEAELYDPATGTFSLTGSMHEWRWAGTATLLNNGRVLVAGGQPSDGMRTGCELYDPATGTWSYTGSLKRPHMRGGAVLLPNGKVLIAGGHGWEGTPYIPIETAESLTELYDPATGTWTFDGRMGSGRDGLSMALLDDGRVLAVGGDLTGPMPDDLNYYEISSDAEVYDPAMGGRGPYSYQLLSGNLALGLTNTSDGFIYGQLTFRGTNTFLASVTDGQGCTSYVVYNIVSKCPTLTMSPDSLPHASVGIPYVQQLTSSGGYKPYTYAVTDGALPDGLNLSMDGYITGTPQTEGVFKFTISATDTNSCDAVHAYSISVVNCPGLPMHVMGLPNGTFGSNYLFDLSAGKWTLTGPLPAGLWSWRTTASLLPNGMVLAICGGKALLYDPTSRTWRYTGSMSIDRVGHTATSLSDGRVLVAGGLGGGTNLATAEIYDPATERWTLTGSLSEAPSWAISALLPSGKVMVNGGVYGTFEHPYTYATELFDPATGTWSRAANSPALHWLGKLVLLPSGKVVAAAGYSWSCDTYDPVTDTWAGGPFCNAYIGASATVLPDGKVLTVGAQDGPQFMFDANANQAIGIGPIHYERDYSASCLLPDGEALIAGGSTSVDLTTEAMASAELFNESTGTWRDAAPMNVARETHAGVMLKDGSFLVVGGADASAGGETFEFVPAGGVAPFAWYVTGGALPDGLSLATNGVISGVPMMAETSTFTVTMVDANGCTGSADFTLVIQPNSIDNDGTPPVVQVTYPRNKALLRNSMVTLIGTAADRGVSKSKLAGVLYSLNGAPKKTAKPLSTGQSWAATVTLQPGWNTCTVQAFDRSGNTSVVSSNVYFQGDATAVAGTYNGLFYEMDGAQPRILQKSAGALLSMSVSIYGPYSGKLYCAGAVYNLAGTFDFSGKSSVTIPRANGALTVNLQLDWTGRKRQITGTVACANEGWTSPLTTELNGYGQTKYAGPRQFTMALARPNSATGAGYGCGSISINGHGVAKLQGALADATPILHSATISRSGRWPVFADLYNHQGLVAGWVDLSGNSPKGQLTWIHPSVNGGNSLSGAATSSSLDAFGSVYYPIAPAIQLPNGTLQLLPLSGSTLAAFNTSVLSNNSVKSPGKTNYVAGVIKQNTGLLTLKFQNPSQGSVTGSGTAVVLQSSNAAFGSFVGSDGSAGALILH